MKLRIPDLTLSALRLYVFHGIPTGQFLEAVLTNDLFGAYDRADMFNAECMKDICTFIYNRCPMGCRGSKENYLNWIEQKGLNRHPTEQELKLWTLQ